MIKIVLVLVVVLFTACTSQTAKPSWITQISDEVNEVCTVGIGETFSHGGIAQQKRIAHIKAKSQIARSIQVYVQSIVYQEKNCTTVECNKDYRSISKQRSQQMLTQTYKTDEWLDTDRNIYYLRLCTHKE